MRWATREHEHAFWELRTRIVRGEAPGEWRCDPNVDPPKFIPEPCRSGAFFKGRYRVPVWLLQFGMYGGVPDFLLEQFEAKCRAATKEVEDGT